MLSLAAHVVGYKMIVGAYNTVNVRCMWEVASSSSGMADVGACILLMLRGMQGVLTCLPGTLNAGVHNTVDA